MTICVPTYNRASCLGQLLVSIRRHAPGFGIVVSDNASTDGTQAVIREFSNMGADIAYHRQPTNTGAVANLLEVVRLADSEWVMLMGDDDAIHAPLGPVAEAMAAGGADAILLGRCDGDAGLAFLRSWPYLASSGAGEGRRIFPEPEALLSAGLCLGAAFSFISGIVVRRGAWLESLDQLKSDPGAQGFSASLFPQAWIVLNLLARGSSVCVIDKPFVMARHGNDRLCENNVLEHARLDIVEFEAIGKYLGRHRPAVFRAMQELIRRHLQRHIFYKPGAAFYYRGKYGEISWRNFRTTADKYIGPSVKLLPSLIPLSILGLAYSMYRKYAKPAG